MNDVATQTINREVFGSSVAHCIPSLSFQPVSNQDLPYIMPTITTTLPDHSHKRQKKPKDNL